MNANIEMSEILRINGSNYDLTATTKIPSLLLHSEDLHSVKSEYGVSDDRRITTHNGNKRNDSHRVNYAVITHEELKNFYSL